MTALTKMSHLAQDRPDEFRWQELLVPLLGLAAVVAVLLAGWWVLHFTGAVDALALAGEILK